MNQSTQNEPTREPKFKVFRVEDEHGNGGWYYASSKPSARAMYSGDLVVREASSHDMLEIGRKGEVVHGMQDPNEGQGRLDMEPPTSEED